MTERADVTNEPAVAEAAAAAPAETSETSTETEPVNRGADDLRALPAHAILSVGECCVVTGCGRGRLLEALKNGALCGAFIGGRVGWRVSYGALALWIDAGAPAQRLARGEGTSTGSRDRAAEPVPRHPVVAELERAMAVEKLEPLPRPVFFPSPKQAADLAALPSAPKPSHGLKMDVSVATPPGERAQVLTVGLEVPAYMAQEIEELEAAVDAELDQVSGARAGESVEAALSRVTGAAPTRLVHREIQRPAFLNDVAVASTEMSAPNTLVAQGAIGVMVRSPATARAKDLAKNLAREAVEMAKGAAATEPAGDDGDMLAALRAKI